MFELLKLRTTPVCVSFLGDADSVSGKFRVPSKRGLKLTICQAVSWARFYGWRVLLTKEDLNCLPAGLAFGLLRSEEFSAEEALSKLMESVGWVRAEVSSNQRWMVFDGELGGLLLEPLGKEEGNPHVVLVYCNPAQAARLVQAYSYVKGEPVVSYLTGRVACSEYAIRPYRDKRAVVVVPGAGDRIFSGTQDDELVFAFPYEELSLLKEGLKEAGAAIGTNRYPFPPYMLSQVAFPPLYERLKEELKVK